MKQIVQTIGAVLAGIFVAFIMTVQFEKLGAYWFPLPNPHPSPLEYMQYMATSPALLHGLSILGYGISIFLGAYVGGRLSPSTHRSRGAYITGFSYLLPVVVLLISFPRPIWAILGILIIMLLSTRISVFLLQNRS
jgi:hypothetical protein